ncbi:hypothetical protein MRX96_010986 [Rhipicephalus microplus]
MCISPNLSSMPLFPGHRYLSPGNSLRNGDRVDEDNGIALLHDEAYERRTTPIWQRATGVLKLTPGNEEQNGDNEKSIPACMRVPRHNFAYNLIHIDKASPRLTKFVNQFPFKGHVGTPIINYEYQFGGDAWLKMDPIYNAGNELLTRTHLGLPTDFVFYTTSNLSNNESYEQNAGAT